MKTDFFAINFETSKIDDYEKRGRVDIFYWSFFSCKNLQKKAEGFTLDDFFQTAKTGTYVVYDLKFFGYFILHFLFENGYTVGENIGQFSVLASGDGKIYQIKVINKKNQNIRFWDMKKKLPFSLKALFEYVGMELKDLPEINYPFQLSFFDRDIADEKAYVIAKCFSSFLEKGYKAMTIGGDALKFFKTQTGKKYQNLFPKLHYAQDDLIRKAYKGGFCYLVHNYANKELESVESYDINSMYPWVLKTFPLPYGDPLYYKGKAPNVRGYDCFFQLFRCRFQIKKGKLPSVQMRGNFFYKQNEYQISSGGIVELCMYKYELDDFLSRYDVYDYEDIEGYLFKSKSGMFDDYIDFFYKQKEEAATPIDRFIAKSFLNLIGGKFGKKMINDMVEVQYDGRVFFKNVGQRLAEGEYLPIAAAMTSIARCIIISCAEKFGDKFIYADTDCLKVFKSEKTSEILDVDEKRLGAWKKDGDYRRVKFVKQKMYIYEEGRDFFVVCAGMKEKLKNDIARFHRFGAFAPDLNYPQALIDFSENEDIDIEGHTVIKEVKGGAIYFPTNFQIHIDNDE